MGETRGRGGGGGSRRKAGELGGAFGPAASSRLFRNALLGAGARSAATGTLSSGARLATVGLSSGRGRLGEGGPSSLQQAATAGLGGNQRAEAVSGEGQRGEAVEAVREASLVPSSSCPKTQEAGPLDEVDGGRKGEAAGSGDKGCRSRSNPNGDETPGTSSSAAHDSAPSTLGMSSSGQEMGHMLHPSIGTPSGIKPEVQESEFQEPPQQTEVQEPPQQTEVVKHLIDVHHDGRQWAGVECMGDGDEAGQADWDEDVQADREEIIREQEGGNGKHSGGDGMESERLPIGRMSTGEGGGPLTSRSREPRLPPEGQASWDQAEEEKQEEEEQEDWEADWEEGLGALKPAKMLAAGTKAVIKGVVGHASAAPSFKAPEDEKASGAEGDLQKGRGEPLSHPAAHVLELQLDAGGVESAGACCLWEVWEVCTQCFICPDMASMMMDIWRARPRCSHISTLYSSCRTSRRRTSRPSSRKCGRSVGKGKCPP